MIEILRPYEKPDVQQQLEAWIAEDYADVRQLLPELPEDIQIYFDASTVVPGHATGGFAYSPTIITFGFDNSFSDEIARRAGVKATTFHESYHLAQGFTFYDENNTLVPMVSAIDMAVFEGAATVFERDYTKSKPGWAEYLDNETMLAWLQEIKELPNEFDPEKWKFYDPKTNQKWILYRTGVYVVDKALKSSGLDILDLRHKSADEILKLADL